jgi:DNA polymerase-3 subunit gamma/tau
MPGPLPTGPATPTGPLPTGPATPPTPAGPELDAETVRRRWPEVLQTVRSLRLATWVLVSQNAQVTEVTADVVTLAFSTPQLATTFRTGPHPANVQRALHETLGLDVRVETTIGVAASGPEAPRESGTAAERAAASWDVPSEPPTDQEATPPDDGARPGPAPRPAPETPGPSGNVRAARPSTRPSTRPAPRDTAPAAPVDQVGDASPDDADLDDSGLVGTPLVVQMLGGTVIDELTEDD